MLQEETEFKVKKKKRKESRDYEREVIEREKVTFAWRMVNLDQSLS